LAFLLASRRWRTTRKAMAWCCTRRPPLTGLLRLQLYHDGGCHSLHTRGAVLLRAGLYEANQLISRLPPRRRGLSTQPINRPRGPRRRGVRKKRQQISRTSRLWGFYAANQRSATCVAGRRCFRQLTS
jgi:hypothetical protein